MQTQQNTRFGIKTGLTLGVLAMGSLWTSYEYISNTNPSITRSVYRQIGDFFDWHGPKIGDCNGYHQEKLDLKKDNIQLIDIISQSFFTTYDPGVSIPAGFFYLQPGDTTVEKAGKTAPAKEKTIATVCDIINSGNPILPFVGDEGEGGYVNRIDLGLPPAEVLGYYYEGKMTEDMQDYPSLLTTDGKLPGSKERTQRIERKYQDAASTLRDYNIKYVFGPVLDTVKDRNLPSEENILSGQDRAISENPDTVIAVSKLYIDAMHEQGIKVIAKHYLGLGYGKNDPHKAITLIPDLSKEEESAASKPFSTLAQSLDGIMVTHGVSSRWGNIPASVSPEVYKSIREDLHFKGLIITDDMAMGGIEQYYESQSDTPIVTASLEALAAGADAIIIKYPGPIPEIQKELTLRMQSDPTFNKSRYESFQRIITFKEIPMTGSDTVIATEDTEKIVWLKRKVIAGETYLGILGAEGAPFVDFDQYHNPFLKDKESYTAFKEEFYRRNGVHGSSIIAGKVYWFPDLSLDGNIAKTRTLQVKDQQPKKANQELTAEFKTGQNFYWYLAGELGDKIYDESGQLLPVTLGPLSQYYNSFKKENPGVTLRKLLPNTPYTFEDINGNGKIDLKKPTTVQR